MLEANRLQLEAGGVTIRDSTINSSIFCSISSRVITEGLAFYFGSSRK
jgi:hypothetical protein